MANDKTCNTHTNVLHKHTPTYTTPKILARCPSTSYLLTCPQEEDDAEHGQDGGHHHPKESVEFTGIGFGGLVLRHGLLPGVYTVPQNTVRSMGQKTTPFPRHDLNTGS